MRCTVPAGVALLATHPLVSSCAPFVRSRLARGTRRQRHRCQALGRHRTADSPPERDARPLVLARSMRRGDGGDEVEFGDGGGRADTERRYGFWARFLACAKPCFMACFDAFSCCASATPSPPRMRRVTTQTSVERLLPRQDLGDATSAVMAPPALMRAPSLPLPPRSPEHNPLARTCAADAELEDDVELCAKKRAAVEQPEECPLCLEVCLC